MDENSSLHNNKQNKPNKLVVNLSTLQLTDDDVSLLSKGLNYCPTPGEPELAVLKADLDKFHLSLRRKAFFTITSGRGNAVAAASASSSDDSVNTVIDIYNQPSFSHNKFRLKSNWNPPGPKVIEQFISLNEQALTCSKLYAPANRNLTPGEQKSLQNLKNNKNIVIKRADKGGAVVVMDKEMYLQEGYRQLSDPKTYRKLETCRTKEYYDRIKLYVTYICNIEREISDKVRDYLINFEPKTARFYLLPKIHKNKVPPPGRPVISSNGAPTERISEFVDHFLKPFVLTTRSYLKDTTDFLNKIKPLSRGNGKRRILFTMDVVSLYTNIPTDVGLADIADYLDSHRDLHARPSNEVLCKLLQLVLTCNDFTFNGDYFLQLFGTAIGTRVAPSYANLVVAAFEEKYVYPYDKQPAFWCRFIDDIFGIWDHSEHELLQFVDSINSKVDSLKFTLEHSTESVPFLDVRVLQDCEGNLTTDLYKKETDARNYLQFSSAHPLSVKRAIPFGQFLRIRRVCSTLDLYDTNAIQMARDFRRRGFPEETITTALIKARRCDRDKLLAPKVIDATKTGVTSDDIFCVQTYTPGQPILADIINTNIPFLNRNPKFRAFQAVSCKNAYRRPKNLSDFLVKATITPDAPKPRTTHHRRGSKLTPFQRMAQSATNLCNTGVTPTQPVTSLCNSPSRAKITRDLPTKCVSSSCRYCYRIDKSGRIKSAFTNREYMSKIHVDCRSSNLIYCLQCDICRSQYVGQTKRQLRDRLSEHLRSMRSHPTASIIAHHFHHDERDPTGVNLRVFVVDFISSNPHSDVAKQRRLDTENKWIHRLRTLFPHGFNHLE